MNNNMIELEKLYKVSEILRIAKEYNFGQISNIYKRVQRPEWKAQRIRGMYMVKGVDLLNIWVNDPPFRPYGKRPIKR